MLVEGHGIPLGQVLAGARRHDSPLLAPTLDLLDELGSLSDEIIVHLDAGYDSGKTRHTLTERGLSGQVAHKGEKAPIQASQRWHTELDPVARTPGLRRPRPPGRMLPCLHLTPHSGKVSSRGHRREKHKCHGVNVRSSPILLGAWCGSHLRCQGLGTTWAPPVNTASSTASTTPASTRWPTPATRARAQRGGSATAPPPGPGLRPLPAAIAVAEEVNTAHARIRGPGERANAQLKSWKILRKIRSSPSQATTLVKAVQTLILAS